MMFQKKIIITRIHIFEMMLQKRNKKIIIITGIHGLEMMLQRKNNNNNED